MARTGKNTWSLFLLLLAGIVQAAQRAGKADVLTAAAAHRLQNNIHIYIVTAQQRKHLKS